MQNKLDKNIEEAIIGIISKKIAPLIGMDTSLPNQIVIQEIKKLISKGRCKIGFITRKETINALTFILASPDSTDRYISIDTGIEVSIDPKIPNVFRMSDSQYNKIIKKMNDIGIITLHDK